MLSKNVSVVNYKNEINGLRPFLTKTYLLGSQVYSKALQRSSSLCKVFEYTNHPSCKFWLSPEKRLDVSKSDFIC